MLHHLAGATIQAANIVNLKRMAITAVLIAIKFIKRAGIKWYNVRLFLLILPWVGWHGRLQDFCLKGD